MYVESDCHTLMSSNV